MRVDFNEHLYPQSCRLPREILDEVKGFGNHETTASRLFDSIPNGIQPHHADAIFM